MEGASITMQTSGCLQSFHLATRSIASSVILPLNLPKESNGIYPSYLAARGICAFNLSRVPVNGIAVI